MSDVGDYILAAKSRGRGLMGIDETAQEIIKQSSETSQGNSPKWGIRKA